MHTPPHGPAELLEALLQSTSDLFAIVDKEFRYLAISEVNSKEFKRVFGKSVKTGDSLYELLSHLPKELERAIQLWGRALSGESFSFVADVNSEFLDRQIYELTFAPLFDKEGKIMGAYQSARNITREQIAQKKLEESEAISRNQALTEMARQELYDFFMQAPVPMVVLTGPDHHFSLANPPYERLIGGREIMGKTLREAFSEEEVGHYVPLIERVYKTGEPYVGTEAPLQLKNENGVVQERFINVGYHPFREPDGKIKGVLAVVVDVTDQVKARQNLERAHLEAQAAAERVQLALAAGAIVGTWDWNLQTDRFTIDERFAENFGIDPAKGRSGLSLEQVIATVHSEDLAGLRAAISDVINRGGAYSHEYRVRGLDGIYRWIEANGRVEHAPDGTPTRFPGVLLDIDQRRELMAERDRATQLLRAFIDAVPGVVYSKDIEGRMLVANRGVSELVGLAHEDIIGKTDIEFLERKDQAEVVMATDRRIMESRVSEEIEEEVSFPDGRRAVWLSTKAPFRDENGKVIGLIGSSIDITARKAAEAALLERTNELTEAQMHLRKALETRDEFLSIASHELKTPLTSIRLQVQMFQREISKEKLEIYSPERVNRLVDQTDKQTLRLARLIEDMLDISRIRSGWLRIELDTFDFCEMVRDVIDRMKPQLLEALGSEPLVITCSSVTGSWDRARLEQVLINLLTNAIRYGKGSPIEIHVQKPDEKHVRLSVRDHGAGIAKEDHERIFNRFERAVGPNEVSGLGLGLSISRELVMAHNGRIWVESEPGYGSTFHIDLPV